jgi:Skp family chaperone for outer membrane proteins
VKRIIGIVAGVAVGAALYGVSLVGAQPGTPAPAQAPTAQPPAHTRLAFVNVAKVFQEYDKARFYKAELEKAIEPKKSLRDKLVKEIQAWKKAMQENPKLKKGDPQFDPGEHERYDKGILKNQRELEDLERDLRQIVGERSEHQNVLLYKELYEAAQLYAIENHFHIVVGFVEPTQGDPFSLINIMRKIQGMDMAGCVTALYVAPGLDISLGVVNALNQRYRAAGGVVPATPVSLPKN